MEGGSVVSIEMNKTPPAGLYEKSLRHLKYLERFESLGLTDDDAQHLPRLHMLNTLSIVSHDLTDDGMESIARIPNLTSLGLGCPSVSERGLEALRHHQALESLGLHLTTGEPLQDYACQASLKRLVVQIPVADEGFGQIVLQFRNLESLGVTGEITPEFIAVVTKLPKLLELRLKQRALVGEIICFIDEGSSLEILSTRGTPIAGTAAQRLNQLRRFRLLLVGDGGLVGNAEAELSDRFSITRRENGSWDVVRKTPTIESSD